MKYEDSAFIGLDIGGQSVKGQRLEADGSVSRRARLATPVGSGAGAVLAVVRDVIAELDAGRGTRIAAVGAGTPGGVDSCGRIAGEVANIPGWLGTQLRDAIEEAAGAPAVVRNDGNMAAFGEWAARGGASRALLFVGLGTGIGGGFVEDGRILSGVDDRALEIGHIVVYPGGRTCACGRSGCVEAYSSGPSIARIAIDLALGRDRGLVLGETEGGAGPGAWEDSPLARAIRGGGAADAPAVYAAFARGDALARRVHALAADALARAVASACALLAPDRIVFGGGVLEGAEAIIADVAALVPRYVFDAAYRDCRFERALLGPRAGLYGAALFGASSILVREELLSLAVAAASACPDSLALGGTSSYT